MAQSGLLGELAVNLVARTQKFEQGMKRGQKSLKGLESRAKATSTSLNVLTKGFIAIGGAMAAQRIASKFLAVAESLDQLGKTAEKLGLQAQTLRSYQVAAEHAGVATGQFNTALQRMTRRVAEAAIGTGEAKDVLRQLNLEAGELVKLNPTEQLLKISDAFKDIGNSNEQIRAAFKLFDTEGVQLVTLLTQGSEAIAASAEKAKAFLPDDKDAENAKAFTAAWLDITTNLKGIGDKIIIDVAPDVKVLVEDLNKLLNSSGFKLLFKFRSLGATSRVISGKVDEIFGGPQSLISAAQPSPQAGPGGPIAPPPPLSQAERRLRLEIARDVAEDARKRARRRAFPPRSGAPLEDLINQETLGGGQLEGVFGGPAPVAARRPPSISELRPNALIDHQIRTIAENFNKQFKNKPPTYDQQQAVLRQLEMLNRQRVTEGTTEVIIPAG